MLINLIMPEEGRGLWLGGVRGEHAGGRKRGVGPPSEDE